MDTRKSLRFNQEVCDKDHFSTVTGDEDEGTIYQEGFTSFSIRGGKVLLNGRELNEREKRKGTPIPRVSPEEVGKMLDIADEFKDDGREIFLLVSNKHSSIVHNVEGILILGYYEGDNFIFAGQDEVLKLRDDVRPMGLAKDIFLRDGMVVVPGPKGQPITVLDINAPYTYITGKFNSIRNTIKELAGEKQLYAFTEHQIFIYMLSTEKEENINRFIDLIKNDSKRYEFIRLKENFELINNIFKNDIFQNDNNVYLSYNSDLNEEEYSFLSENENLPKVWKLIYSISKSNFDKDGDIDSFKKLVRKPFLGCNNIIAKVTKLCNKYSPEKHSFSN